ncbi:MULTISPECIES: hypothetical protein [Cupriavidus]|uniref:Uncharacterized protein n=1 Tax=Cupriavidus basilensis TaxID=68895 RepID=A0A643FSE8_9BURK|nr:MULTISPECIES: hypothetical protein [Cupriavidus]KUE86373.1 hypothetical protein ASL20_23180 [Cupriavidus necator]NOV23569.1 hypothetical protein [Cupriavidus necator]QOT81643.1 hypothetical protein F7R26_037140 [Cupriavidus basilensis]BDB30146.1 hypothetical protein CTP10_R75630 [Cupriavidus sp. P-10]
MDINEIERLHAHYAEPPVTIELAPSGAASLSASSALPPTHTPSGNEAVPAWARIKPIHWRGLGIVLIAVLAFGGGRWLASGDTHKRPESSTAAALPAAIGPAEDGGHEWPASQPSVAQPAAAEPTPVPSPSAAPAVSAPAPAASSAAAAENRAKPQAPKAQVPKQNMAAPAPTRLQPASPPQTAQVTPASSRGNEIKLF